MAAARELLHVRFAAYAAGFTPDGRVLTVVIDRPETYPSTAARDTVFTWQEIVPGA